MGRFDFAVGLWCWEMVADRGARETALASMRCGSSRMMGARWIFGRSVESGDDQPG